MAGDEGDAYTLGLLVELRALCQKIADHNDAYSMEAHHLLQRLSNPNLHGLEAHLHFRVVQLGPGYYGETLRIVSANANAALGHAAFHVAVKHYPNCRWMLTWHGGVANRYDPPGMDVS